MIRHKIYNILCSVFILLLFASNANAQSSEKALQDSLANANSYAQNGLNAQAIDTYEYIISQGYTNSSVYYNLGYVYYKQGNLGRAILNMERAKKLNPNDPDVLYNLDHAYALTDQMQVVEPVFFEAWWDSFKSILSPDGWAWAFAIVFILMLGGIAAFLFANSISARKIGFFGALACALLCIITFSIALNKRGEITDSTEGIILSSSVTLTTSPDKNGSEMAVLHEGTHIEIISILNDWAEVRLKDGNVGWLKITDFEKI
ncbi:MAG: tetratricopeptide repeat protein [Bacteroidia bacterium]|nr:tetratricopeptide repeat protein [Bacteroidia bacterium]